MTPTTIMILQGMWTAAISFLVLTFAFWPLEKLYPAKEGQAFFRPEWLTDICFFLGHYMVWNSLMLSMLIALKSYLDYVAPEMLRTGVHAMPWWLQAFTALFLSDLAIYWGHRWQHNNEWLWSFHSVHHSSEHLDWLAAHREHPLDTVFTMGLINLPPLLLGFPLATIAGITTFRGMWAIYIHSNVRLPLGPLRVLIGAPELHHWHHDRDRSAGNYANISPIMDVIFGTYKCPDHEPRAFGLGEPAAGEKPYPRTYLGQLLHPFRLHWPGRTNAEEKSPHIPSPALTPQHPEDQSPSTLRPDTPI